LSQISLTSSNDDKSYERKKLKRACKKVKSIAAWMLRKSSVSADDCKAFWKELNTICIQVKQKPSSKSTSPSVQKGSQGNVSLSDKDHRRPYKELCDMEMPLVDNGNMKHFHKSFCTYYPCMLMFKEKYGHLRIPGDDPKKEWPGRNGLKTLGLPCPSMIVTAVVGLKLNQRTTICWFPQVLLFMFRLKLYEVDYIVSYFPAML
jgi:hypothetical protein